MLLLQHGKTKLKYVKESYAGIEFAIRNLEDTRDALKVSIDFLNFHMKTQV
jgi:hypothetical protein